MATKADKFREGAFKMNGDPYMLGYEGNPDDVSDPDYDVYDPPGSNPRWGDCSGDVWSLLIYSGACLNGKPITKASRRTAHGWYTYAGAQPLPPPIPANEVGIFGFLVNASGRAYHMFATIGAGQVFEMGYNHQARITNISTENARGAKWRRYNFDLGMLTTDPVVPVWPLLFFGVHSSDPVRQKAIAKAVSDYKIAMNTLLKAGLHPKDPDYLEACTATTRRFQSNTANRDQDRNVLKVDGEVGPKTRYALAVALAKVTNL